MSFTTFQVSVPTTFHSSSSFLCPQKTRYPKQMTKHEATEICFFVLGHFGNITFERTYEIQGQMHNITFYEFLEKTTLNKKTNEKPKKTLTMLN